MYHLTFRSLLDELYGPDDGMLIVRSASHGNQSLGTIIWPGDLNNDFSRFGDRDDEGKWKVGGLPAAVSAAISLSASAFPYFASDTGGFQNGIPTSEVLVRWIQFSALSPFFQLGGGGQNHNPWDSSLYPEPYVLPAFIRYARLHGDLFPYFRTLVEQAATKGVPIIRALGLMFPDDPVAWTIGDAYMLGDNLLVAPVIEQGAVDREVYLPQGVWADFWTGITYTGPNWIRVEAPLTADEYPVPLFMRVGSIVPMAAKDIDTLVPTSNPEIVTYEDRTHFLRARVVPGDGKFTLWDKRHLRSKLRRNRLTLESNHMKNNQLIWELDLKPWGISQNYKVFDKHGEFYSVPLNEINDCVRCYYFDNDRWLYISTIGNSRVIVRKM
jgi:alpha-D-xyloside xylohydrolase